jgi:hypothetical protein
MNRRYGESEKKERRQWQRINSYKDCVVGSRAPWKLGWDDKSPCCEGPLLLNMSASVAPHSENMV